MESIPQEEAKELRSLNIERLNHMLLVLWPQIQAGNERSIDTGLRIMERLDRLMGTEAGSVVDVNVNHAGAILTIQGDKDSYIAAMKRMAGITQDGTNKPIEVQEAPKPLTAGTAVDPVVGSTAVSEVVVGDVEPNLPQGHQDQHPTTTPTSNGSTHKPGRFTVPPKEEDE
jgi:hypothetical protein